MVRGYFGIAMLHSKTEENVGSMLRTASSFGASFLAIIGKRYSHQNSDTLKSYRHTPLFYYKDYDDFLDHKPKDCSIVAIELHKESRKLKTFCHPERSIYLLGAEDRGISEDILNKCDSIVQIPGKICLNVSVAGSIVLYDRLAKGKE
jgi:tRNA G18 (ribose-2'-O)-methylase SpoU